jgi:hypothetical protein
MTIKKFNIRELDIERIFLYMFFIITKFFYFMTHF